MPSGTEMPVFGIGTWRMGESGRKRAQELDAIKYALELGYPMIDTAEMYGDGGAEEIIAEALAGSRQRPFIVSKVYPHNATRSGTIAACERSLKRLKLERIDLYLLHWRGGVRLSETYEAFFRLRAAGKIADFGVSNFDTDDMEEAAGLDKGLTGTNQVLYCLSRRGPEYDLLPTLRERSIPLMAYSPLDQGRLLGNATLKTLAGDLRCTPAQLALAWVLAQPGVGRYHPQVDDARAREGESRGDGHQTGARPPGRARPRLSAAQGQAVARDALILGYSAVALDRSGERHGGSRRRADFFCLADTQISNAAASDSLGNLAAERQRSRIWRSQRARYGQWPAIQGPQTAAFPPAIAHSWCWARDRALSCA
jgi:diketogulonate reductase-like aldo/keto reductase